MNMSQCLITMTSSKSPISKVDELDEIVVKKYPKYRKLYFNLIKNSNDVIDIKYIPSDDDTFTVEIYCDEDKLKKVESRINKVYPSANYKVKGKKIVLEL